MRAWTASARDVVPGPAVVSTIRAAIPCRARNSASARPVGPAPTISTSQSGADSGIPATLLRWYRYCRTGVLLMHKKRLALAIAILALCAAPAAAQRYTAKQDGDVVELADTSAQMNVSVV